MDNKFSSAVDSNILQFADDLKMFWVIHDALDFHQLQEHIDKFIAWAKSGNWDSMFLNFIYFILESHINMVNVIFRDI